MAQIKTTYDSGGSGRFALDALADPKDTFRFFDDFFTATGPHILEGTETGSVQQMDLYKIVQLESNSTLPAIDSSNACGILRITTGGTADMGHIIHPEAKINRPDQKSATYEVRVAVNDVSASNFFFGFAEDPAESDTIQNGAVVAAANGKDRIGWFNDTNTTTGAAQVFCSFGSAGLAGTTNGELDTMFGNGSSNTAASDGDFVRFGVEIVGGSKVNFYYNGDLKHTVSDVSKLSDAKLYPIMLMTTNADTAETFDVDYIDVSGER